MPILPKKKVENNGNFWTIAMGQPSLKNINFSTFWTSCFYSVERRFFVIEYPERHFPCLCCLKRQVGLMVIFGQKPWVNPFVKMSIFFTFRTCCFYSVEKSFVIVTYRKRHFPGLYCIKKKVWKNGHFLKKNHWLTPLEKCKFFDFLNFLSL